MSTIFFLGIFLIALLLIFHQMLSRNKGYYRHPKRRMAVRLQPEVERTPKKIVNPQSIWAPFAKLESPLSDEERTYYADIKNLNLIQFEDCSKEVIQNLKTITDKIARPKGISAYITLQTSEPKELAEMVSTDPSLTARLLRMVNSAAYNLANEITSVRYAVIYLGTMLVKDIVLRMSMQDVLESSQKEMSESYQLFWNASVLASSLCSHLGTFFELEEPATLATQSLLSFIGNLVILSRKNQFVEIYKENPSLYERTEMEQKILRANAAVVGGMLSTRWQLPQSITQGIFSSLLPMVQPPQDIQDMDIRRIILPFLSARIAEQMVFEKTDDIAACYLSSQRQLEYRYLCEYLEMAKLQGVVRFLKDPKIRMEFHKIYHQLSEISY